MYGNNYSNHQRLHVTAQRNKKQTHEIYYKSYSFGVYRCDYIWL